MDKRFTYLVIKYLENKLGETEKAELEKYLLDPVCAAYLKDEEKAEKIIVEGFQNIIKDIHAKEGLDAYEDESMEEIINDIKLYGNLHNPDTKKRVQEAHQYMLRHRKRIRLIRYSAAAAAVIIGIVFFLTTDFTSSPDKLLIKYYKPYEYIVTRSEDEDHTQFNHAINAYITGNYSTGAGICREILNSEPRRPEYRFLYGLNLMALDSMASAIQQFNTLKALPLEEESMLYFPVHWYSGLCYLGMGNLDSASNELDKIEGLDYGMPGEYRVKELKAELKKLRRRPSK